MTNQYSTTPLRRRMIEDMTMRKLNPKTQSAYIRTVKKSPFRNTPTCDLQRFFGI